MMELEITMHEIRNEPRNISEVISRPYPRRDTVGDEVFSDVVSGYLKQHSESEGVRSRFQSLMGKLILGAGT